MEQAFCGRTRRHYDGLKSTQLLHVGRVTLRPPHTVAPHNRCSRAPGTTASGYELVQHYISLGIRWQAAPWSSIANLRCARVCQAPRENAQQHFQAAATLRRDSPGGTRRGKPRRFDAHVLIPFSAAASDSNQVCTCATRPRIGSIATLELTRSLL